MIIWSYLSHNSALDACITLRRLVMPIRLIYLIIQKKTIYFIDLN